MNYKLYPFLKARHSIWNTVNIKKWMLIVWCLNVCSIWSIKKCISTFLLNILWFKILFSWFKFKELCFCRSKSCHPGLLIFWKTVVNSIIECIQRISLCWNTFPVEIYWKMEFSNIRSFGKLRRRGFRAFYVSKLKAF